MSWGPTPEDWIAAFRGECHKAETSRCWTGLANSLVCTGLQAGGPEHPAHSSSLSVAEYNTAIITALQNVRQQLRAVLRRELRGPDQWAGPVGPYGRFTLKSHATWLLGQI